MSKTLFLIYKKSFSKNGFFSVQYIKWQVECPTQEFIMKTKVGIGVSEQEDSLKAGKEVAQKALDNAGIETCDFLIFYTSDYHDPLELKKGIQSIVGEDCKIFGGHSMGVITNNFLGYDGFQVGAAAISSNSIQIDLFKQVGLANNEYATGKALAEQIQAQGYEHEPNILFMYDSVKKTAAQGLELNLATPVIAGMKDAFGEFPPIAGVGMTGGMQWKPTYQWINNDIEQNSMIASVFSGKNVKMDSLILHGCVPSGAYHTITKAKENIVYEIDGKPSLDFFDELMQGSTSWDEYPLFLTLGLNKGDKFEDFKQENYANRLCMTIDKEQKALVMFEPDLTEGSEIRLMRRSIDFDYIKPTVENFLKTLQGREPVFAIYIDCLARASAYCGSEGEEAAEVQKALGDIPLLGMYSGVEVGKVKNEVQALDWTGVLCLFSE